MIRRLLGQKLNQAVSSTFISGIIMLFLCLLNNTAIGQTYSYVGGTSSNIFPFSSTTNKVQWLMKPTYFPTAPSGNMTVIYIKPATSATNATYSDFTVRMGTTSLTAMATGPFITPLTTVYYSASQTFPTVTAGGWISVTLQTPFFYDGISNFILEVSQTAYSNGFNVAQDIAIANARIYGTVAGGTGTTATGVLNFGFDITSATCSGTPTAPTITTAPLTVPVCSSPTTITATYPVAASGGITYQWEQAASATGPWSSVAGGTGATTLSYTTAPITVPTWYRIKAICSASSQITPSAAFAVPVAQPQPGLIAGSITFCPGNVQQYTVPVSTLPASYNWTLPASWAGSSNTESMTAVTNGTAGGNISVTATGACGTSVPRTLAVTLGTAPAQPAAITGNTVVCAGATQSYTIPAVAGATSYIWTLPTGWTGTSTANSITVTPSATAGNITVKAVNNCGQSLAQTLAVTTTTQPLTVGPILGDTAVCLGAAKLFRVIRIPNALNYTWTTPSGWSGVSTTDSLNIFYISGTGTITVRANNGCAGAVPGTLTVNVLPTLTPAVTASATATTVCSGVPVDFVATPVNGGAAPTYRWLVNGTLAGVAPTFSSSTLTNNDLVSVVMTSSYLCTTAPNVASNALRMIVSQSVTPGVNVNSTSQEINCASNTVTFTAVALSGGNAPSYQWMRNANPVGSNTPTYTLATPNNGDSIYCVLTSNVACATQNVVPSNKIGLAVTATVTPGISISVNPGTTIANGQNVTFTANPVNGGTSPTYQWIKNSVAINGANSATYTTNTLRHGDQIGVQMISSNICAVPSIAASSKVVISVPSTGVGNVNGVDSKITLVPNPNTGQFTITADWDPAMNGRNVQVDVLNTVGQVVYTNSMKVRTGNWQSEISLTDIPAGLYLLRLKANDIQYIRKFEVNK